MFVIRFTELRLFASAMVLAVAGAWNPLAAKDTVKLSTGQKKVIGPTAVVEEAESDIVFAARVDTGATTSSIHVEECKVESAAPKMEENVGKKIRFKIKNPKGESEWLEREIAEISTIKTSEQEEVRYKVPITLNVKDVKKRVLVSLNDRSHMTYPVLLGRNFLQGDFVVDVDLENEQTGGPSSSAKEQPSKDTQSDSADRKTGS